MQQVWDRQVTVCYLLGLDWSIPAHFQELRDREKVRKELRKAAQTGELGPYIGNTAELRTRLAVAENRADGLRGRLESFQVVPQYKELEVEASRITGEIDNLNIENVVDHDLIRELQESLTTRKSTGYSGLGQGVCRGRHRPAGPCAEADCAGRAVPPHHHRESADASWRRDRERTRTGSRAGPSESPTRRAALAGHGIVEGGGSARSLYRTTRGAREGRGGRGNAEAEAGDGRTTRQDADGTGPGSDALGEGVAGRYPRA